MTEVQEKYVSEVTTPSGVEVRFSIDPKRKYEVRYATPVEDEDGPLPEDAWREVPSVTTVLGVLDKPGLPWWGMKVGVQGVIDLADLHLLNVVKTADEIIGLLTEHKLTVNHVRDKAGSRGTAVHDAFELWAREGHKPDPGMFPPEERGYVEGLLAFLNDLEPEPEDAEVMVGSVEHGFAGRYDIRFRTSAARQVVHHRTPKRGPQYATLEPGLFLGDLKTSSGIYSSHSRQLEAYELASVECGYEPTDARGIIHVSADGTYEFVRSTAQAEDFLCVLAVWQSDKAMAERGKRK